MEKYDQEKIIRKAIAEIFSMHGAEEQESVYEELASLYERADRHHHSFEHIADMLLLAERFPLEDPLAFKAAILYHDIIYEVHRYAPTYKSLSNEEHSAIVCTNTLERHNISSAVIERARNLIQWTETHKVPDGDEEAALFMDIDMAVLGSSPERYQRYARETAQEFLRAFTPAQYETGRTVFLNKVKGQPVFQTPHFAHLNGRVHENNEWELQNIHRIVHSSTYNVSPQLAL